MSEFWAQLTAQEQTDFVRRSGRRQWRRGDVLCHEADESDWVVLLQEGRVKATSHTAAGSEVVLAVRGPGALIGELSAVDRQPRSATIQALEPVTGLVMALPEFEAFLQANGRVAVLLMRLVTGKLRDADRKRIEYGAFDTTGRVATRLVELAERYGEKTDGGLRVMLPLSQDELAGWTGASREAVSKALRTLRRHGWIETGRRRVIVHDLQALRRHAR